jgi:LDH2 family malate/lactate/ureidoglycolate dehydrogenase
MTQLRINNDALKSFAEELLRTVGVDAVEAAEISRVFVWTDMVGRSFHGVSRLPVLIKRLKLGLINSPCDPVIQHNSSVVTTIDGKNGFGQYLGQLAMTEASRLAKNNGVGVVVVRNSNHFGAGAYYVNLAASQNQIGIAVSNSVPKVAPYGGTTPVLGTNPFAFGAPTENGQAILADFSTSAILGSKVIEAIAEKRTLPQGLAVDAAGNSIIDPTQIGHGAILPFGGAKGFCVGLMVEILSGVLTGAGISHGVASMYEDFSRPANTGHFFIAIDIAHLMPLQDYYQRMSQLIAFVKSAGKAADSDEILLPGEQRWRIFDEQKAAGVPVDDKTANNLDRLAAEFGVPLPW